MNGLLKNNFSEGKRFIFFLDVLIFMPYLRGWEMNQKRKIKFSSPRVIGAAKSRVVYEALYPLALEERTNPTDAEKVLWNELRNSRLGIHFRRQHIIDQFVVDFYCVKYGLIIEVDGPIHKYHHSHDQEREIRLCSLGCRIIRFSNEEILFSIQSVVKKIKGILSEYTRNQ